MHGVVFIARVTPLPRQAYPTMLVAMAIAIANAIDKRLSCFIYRVTDAAIVPFSTLLPLYYNHVNQVPNGLKGKT